MTKEQQNISSEQDHSNISKDDLILSIIRLYMSDASECDKKRLSSIIDNSVSKLDFALQGSFFILVEYNNSNTGYLRTFNFNHNITISKLGYKLEELHKLETGKFYYKIDPDNFQSFKKKISSYITNNLIDTISKNNENIDHTIELSFDTKEKTEKTTQAQVIELDMNQQGQNNISNPVKNQSIDQDELKQNSTQLSDTNHIPLEQSTHDETNQDQQISCWQSFIKCLSDLWHYIFHTNNTAPEVIQQDHMMLNTGETDNIEKEKYGASSSASLLAMD